MRFQESLTRWSERIFGPPPAKDAPKLVAWTYVRRIYLRLLPFTIPAWILAAVSGVTWLWIPFGVSAVTWVIGMTSISLRINRLRKAPPQP